MGEINWKDKCWITTIYLIRPDGKVLLSMNKNMKTWIPIGGHIDIGETPEEAVIREVAEETGFSFEFASLPEIYHRGQMRVIKPYHIQIEKVHHHGHHINIVFFGRCTKWNDKKETDENEELRWFSAQELESSRGKLFDSVIDNSLAAIKAVHRN